jgi:hypothetical protein
MTEAADIHATPRQRLLVVTAMLLESLYDPAAVQVLRTLKPQDMRSGGARVPGTSYELPAATATRAMQELLALRGGRADALLVALAGADIDARLAALGGRVPPVLASLYPFCTADTAAAGSESLPAALRRLYLAAEKIFTLTHMRRIDKLCFAWSERPASVDEMPVQQFVAGFVRNAPP